MELKLESFAGISGFVLQALGGPVFAAIKGN